MPPLPAAELDVLACLQRLGEAAAADIRRELRPFRAMAHGSVLTLLGRLEKKALVTRAKGPSGKAFVYRPAVPARATQKPLVRHLLQRGFAGDKLALVSALFETRPPTAVELAGLERLVAELRTRTYRPS